MLVGSAATDSPGDDAVSVVIADGTETGHSPADGDVEAANSADDAPVGFQFGGVEADEE